MLIFADKHTLIMQYYKYQYFGVQGIKYNHYWFKTILLNS